MLRRTFLASSILALTAAGVLPAAAQSDFPQRPIQMIVPWGAGGGTDAVGRIVLSLIHI